MKKQPPKVRSPFARALEQAQYRRHVIKSRKLYSRKGNVAKMPR